MSTTQAWYGLYFNLLVDGVPVQNRVDVAGDSVSYWLVEDGLPESGVYSSRTAF